MSESKAESRRRIPGTKEILFTGIPIPIAEELKRSCEGRGATGKNWTYGELFMTEMYPLWKTFKARQSQKGKRIQVEAHWGRPGHGHKEAGNG